ncbi:MAG TPA: WG repeat-containing protein, partial [Bacteroidia bacterium]|nr:WG repeat-containing protein [Bacteroidia bacterium]
MKPIFNIFVFLFFLCPILSNSQITSVSIASAQLKLDSMQIKGKDFFKVVDEKAVKLDNGDVITTAVCFCDNMPGGRAEMYSSFTRSYGLTTKIGKKWNPVYQNIVYWENDQYLVKYHDYGPPGEYQEEGWFAVVDRNLKVLNVFMEEGISEEYYSVKKNGKYGTVSSTLNEYLPFAFDSLSELSFRAEVEIMVKERSFYTYAAKKNKKWGLITTESDTIVPFKYDFLENSFYGKMIAKYKGKWGIIDQADSAIVPFIYDSIFMKRGTFLLKGKKWALLPDEFKYKNAQHQFDGFAFNP